MARIPFPKSTEGIGGVPGGGYASAAMFGAGDGAALQQASAGLAALGGAAFAEGRRDRLEEERQSVVANVASFDFSKRMLELKAKAAADGSGLGAQVAEEYDRAVDLHLEGVTDGRVRTQVKTALLARRPGTVESANAFEASARVEDGKRQANDALGAVINRVRSDPLQYDQAAKDAEAVIASRSEVPEAVRATMRINGRNALATARFDALTAAADTPEALAGIKAELQNPPAGGPDWRKEMLPADYDKALDRVTQAERAMRTQEGAAARAGVSGLTERHAKMEVIDPAEMAAVGALVQRSKDPSLQWRFAQMQAQQDIYKNYKGLPPAQLRAKAEEVRLTLGTRGLPQDAARAIEDASAIVGGVVSPSYLAGMLRREYREELDKPNPDWGKPTSVRKADGTLGSDALGSAQFISSTWLRLIKAQGSRIGVDLAGKSDQQLLDLRKDVVTSMKMSALYAEENAAIIKAQTGITPTDGDLYTAHFMGPGGAVKLILAARDNPNAAAAQMFPAEAAANLKVFYHGGDTTKPYSVGQLRANLAAGFMGDPGRVAFARVQAFDAVVREQRRALADDPVTYIQSTGRFNMGSLAEPGGFMARGHALRSASDYFGVPAGGLKPFTKEEADYMAKTIKEGSVEDAVTALSSVASMGGDVARAAFKQIGEKDPVFALAGSLAHERGARDTATDILKGARQLRDNKDIKDVVGAQDSEITAAFYKTVGKGLGATSPAAMQALRDAALSHYVQTSVVQGGTKAGVFDPTKFSESVSAVLGGRAGSPGVGEVNGAPTVLPQGVKPEEFDKALDRMRPDDYIRMSADGRPPRYATGEIAEPAEIAREGKFRWQGGNQYLVEMADGKYLISAYTADKQAVFYSFKATPEAMKEMLTRPTTPAPASAAPAGGGATDRLRRAPASPRDVVR